MRDSVGWRRRCGRCGSLSALRLLKSGQARFQSFDRLLLVRDLLLEVIELSQARSVVFVIGLRVDVVLFQSEIPLKKVQTFLCFGELLFHGCKFSGGFLFFLCIVGGCGWSSSARGRFGRISGGGSSTGGLRRSRCCV